ncbi:MAG TPA: hypothetical protein VFO97_08380, partial [Desertimonas sp.]|nr:hypothetical protein [Desertimonas sp.]
MREPGDDLVGELWWGGRVEPSRDDEYRNVTGCRFEPATRDRIDTPHVAVEPPWPDGVRPRTWVGQHRPIVGGQRGALVGAKDDVEHEVGWHVALVVGWWRIERAGHRRQDRRVARGELRSDRRQERGQLDAVQRLNQPAIDHPAVDDPAVGERERRGIEPRRAGSEIGGEVTEGGTCRLGVACRRDPLDDQIEPLDRVRRAERRGGQRAEQDHRLHGVGILAVDLPRQSAGVAAAAEHPAVNAEGAAERHEVGRSLYGVVPVEIGAGLGQVLTARCLEQPLLGDPIRPRRRR